MPGPDTTIVVRPTTPFLDPGLRGSPHTSHFTPAPALYLLVSVVVACALLIARRRRGRVSEASRR